MTKFKMEDFPIGSYLYFFRIVDIQVNPQTRKSGEKRHFKGYAYSKAKITHYVGNSLVGVEGDNSNEGFDVKEFRKYGGSFVVPQWVFEGLKGIPSTYKFNLSIEQKLNTLLNDGTGNHDLNTIVKETHTEINFYHSKAPWNKFNKAV